MLLQCFGNESGAFVRRPRLLTVPGLALPKGLLHLQHMTALQTLAGFKGDTFAPAIILIAYLTHCMPVRRFKNSKLPNLT